VDADFSISLDISRIPRDTYKQGINDCDESKVDSPDMKQSAFLDDDRILNYLNNGKEEDDFEEVDMGQIEDEDKQFMIIDKDTGKAYDLRKQGVVNKMTEPATRVSVDTSANPLNVSIGQKAWTDWWKQKKKNNLDLMSAAGNGDVAEIKRLLNMQDKDLQADINA